MQRIKKEEAAKLTEPHLDDGTYKSVPNYNQNYVVVPSEEATVKQSSNNSDKSLPSFVLFVLIMVMLASATLGLKGLFTLLFGMLRPKIGNRTKKPAK
jgi:hypothetical protein